MKERGILMSAPMALAVRRAENPKTQTRRVVKGEMLRAIQEQNITGFTGPLADSPYGRPGDHLWVRETYQLSGVYDHLKPSLVPVGPVAYLADGRNALGKTRVSIHMPRWAARTVLEITEVRIERLQDCSRADACAEGLSRNATGYVKYWTEGLGGACGYHNDPISAYAALWDHINTEPGKTWADNPFVWCVSFRRLP